MVVERRADQVSDDSRPGRRRCRSVRDEEASADGSCACDSSHRDNFAAKHLLIGVNAARRISIYTLALSLLVWAPTAHGAQKLKDADCLACHSDQTLTTDVNGKPLSLFVDAGKLKHTIHGRLFACVDCHTDVKSLVHDTPPKKITCGAVPCGCAGGLRTERSCDRAQDGRAGGGMPGLPWRRA